MSKLELKVDRFDFEQQIMECWAILDQIKILHVGVSEYNLTNDQVSNALLGINELYAIRFEQLFHTFSQLVNEGKIQ